MDFAGSGLRANKVWMKSAARPARDWSALDETRQSLCSRASQQLSFCDSQSSFEQLCAPEPLSNTLFVTTASLGCCPHRAALCSQSLDSSVTVVNRTRVNPEALRFVVEPLKADHDFWLAIIRPTKQL